jgi:hypothetical protein
MCLFLHENNRFLRLSKRGSQVVSLFGLAPIGSPRYLKGIEPSLQLRNKLAISKNVDGTFTPMRALFQKFTFKPEANSKPRRIALRVQRSLCSYRA